MRRLLLVAAAALSIRLGYIYLNPPPAAPLGDALEYHTFASSLADRGVYEGPGEARATRMPGYPALLAVSYSAFGRSPYPVLLFQAVLGVLTCLLLVPLAGRFLEPPWPLLCAAAAACYYDLFSTTASLLSECAYSFLLAAAFAALYRRAWPPARRAALFGLLSCAAYYMRPELLPMAGAGFVLLALLPEDGFRPKHAVLAAAMFALGAVPWAWRNQRLFHRAVPISTGGGINLYSGLQLPLQRNDASPETFFFPAPGLGEAERNDAYNAAFHSLWSRLGPREILRAYAFDLFTHFYPFLPGYDFTFVFLVPFWVYGLVLSVRRKELWPVSVVVLGSVAAYTVFGGPASRYRDGYSPLLILLAGVGLADLWKRRPGPAARWTGAWFAFNASVAVLAGPIRQLMLMAKAVLFR